MYQVEGIGYDFVPGALSREPGLINEWVKVGDADSFRCAKDVMKLEGLLVGGSAGSAIAGAISWLKEIPERDFEGQNVVIMLPDGLRNYMSKPWFAEGLLGREIGADLGAEVAVQINKVLADNHKYSIAENGDRPVKPNVEEAVTALTNTLKDTRLAVNGINGVNGIDGVDGLNGVGKATA